MQSAQLDRRRLPQAVVAGAIPVIGARTAHAAPLPPARADIGAAAYAFGLGQVWLTAVWVIAEPAKCQANNSAAVCDPLAADQDQLSGLHAGTRIPRVV